jgi:iron complex outermembrane receptor protein
MRKTILAIALASLSLSVQSADSSSVLPTITISAAPDTSELDSSKLTAASAADLFSEGSVAFSSAGGISALPSLNGLADDRIRIRVDGREVTSACGNHMNPPLSYVDPQQVSRIDVIAGVTPVSLGGDSIAGTITVNTTEPVFAKASDQLRKEGSLSLAAHSIDHGYSAALGGSVASDRLSLGYYASWRAADSYKDGNGDKVLDTLYKARNQSLTLGAQGEGNRFVFRVGEQKVPYQGFPNQFMDMVDNHAVFASLSYAGDFNWGKLNTRLYWQDTKHEMGFFTPEKVGVMPMNTHGVDLGYEIKADIPLSEVHLVRVGNEYHRLRLDDWWPPVTGSMMMGPNTFWNINNGERDRFVLYGEFESRWDEKWTSVLGLREEFVRMNTGTVQPYNPMVSMMNQDPTYAAAFNATDRSKHDNNLDLSALARYQPDSTAIYEFGFARKSRSPNLYERYTWGRNTMDMMMIGWFGDANGYVGNPDLKPEVANTVSASATWKAADAKAWEFKLAPHFSYVQDFIDVDPLGTYHPYNIATVTRALLHFANHDARLWGIDMRGKMTVWNSNQYSRGQLKGSLAWTRGERTDGSDLYHIMPLNGSVSIEQMVNAWTNSVELQVIDSKTNVDLQRYEPVTDRYALVNLRTSYQMNNNVNLTFGIRNLFDKQYDLPLGGVSIAALKAAGIGPLLSLPGPGRSFDAGLNIKF